MVSSYFGSIIIREKKKKGTVANKSSVEPFSIKISELHNIYQASVCSCQTLPESRPCSDEPQ